MPQINKKKDIIDCSWWFSMVDDGWQYDGWRWLMVDDGESKPKKQEKVCSKLSASKGQSEFFDWKLEKKVCIFN